jgi:hypothetical protein
MLLLLLLPARLFAVGFLSKLGHEELAGRQNILEDEFSTLFGTVVFSFFVLLFILCAGVWCTRKVIFHLEIHNVIGPNKEVNWMEIMWE